MTIDFVQDEFKALGMVIFVDVEHVVSLGSIDSPGMFLAVAYILVGVGPVVCDKERFVALSRTYLHVHNFSNGFLMSMARVVLFSVVSCSDQSVLLQV